MTLVSRATIGGLPLFATLADLPAHLLHVGARERRSLVDGHCDPQRTLPDDSNFARHRLDRDLSFLDCDSECHPRQNSGLVSNDLGKDQASGSVDGSTNGILHGSKGTTSLGAHGHQPFAYEGDAGPQLAYRFSGSGRIRQKAETIWHPRFPVVQDRADRMKPRDGHC